MPFDPTFPSASPGSPRQEDASCQTDQCHVARGNEYPLTPPDGHDRDVTQNAPRDQEYERRRAGQEADEWRRQRVNGMRKST